MSAKSTINGCWLVHSSAREYEKHLEHSQAEWRSCNIDIKLKLWSVKKKLLNKLAFNQVICLDQLINKQFLPS